MLNFSNYFIPENIKKELAEYISNGVSPGDFLYSVLSNNLVNAVKIGTASEFASLPEILNWLERNAPVQCWSTEAKVLRWMENFPMDQNTLA